MFVAVVVVDMVRACCTHGLGVFVALVTFSSPRYHSNDGERTLFLCVASLAVCALVLYVIEAGSGVGIPP